MKFLRFLTKKKTFNFCGLIISAPKKKCLYYRKQQLKRCYDKQLVHITVVLRSENIFSSLECFQMLQLLNTHSINFKFVLRYYLFTVFAINFVDRKYEVNSWIDIGIKSNFHTLSYYIFLKRIMIRRNCIQFFSYNVDITRKLQQSCERSRLKKNEA